MGLELRSASMPPPPMSRMEIEFAQQSERVKSVDLHPTHPWMLASFYSGSVRIWDYASQTMLKSFQPSDQPVRSAKFIARKQWVVAGGDDASIHVCHHDTTDRVTAFEAHSDFIRSVAVHPTLPYVLSSSDDALIKLWDWEQGWACIRIFEGHSSYVMQVAFNPRDPHAFASASFDGTAKLWSLGSPHPEFTLEGHQKSVNCVDYFATSDKTYVITGSDDYTAKVWDYETRSCVQTLEGHAHNVSAVCFHPELPIIVTVSENGTLHIWHSSTYRLETTVNYGYGRAWAVGCVKGSTRMAMGYDEGTIMIKMGHEVETETAGASSKVATDGQLRKNACFCVWCKAWCPM